MESPSLPLSRYVQIARPAVRWPAKRVGCTNSVPSNAPTTHNLLLGRGDEQLLCVEWAQTAELTIEAPPPPPPPPPPRPRYEASVRSIHPGAVTPGGTYLGDTVRVRFRNATARPADAQGYRVCYTQNRRLACRNRRIIGRSWDAWRLRITPPLAGYKGGRFRRYLEFPWRVEGRIVARKRIRIFYDVRRPYGWACSRHRTFASDAGSLLPISAYCARAPQLGATGCKAPRSRPARCRIPWDCSWRASSRRR